MDLTYPWYIALGMASLAGLVSFFSPCVLGILPVYIGYLSGNTAHASESSRSRLMLNTFCFVLGIGVTFVILGIAATALGELLASQKRFLSRLGGLVIIAFGMLQLGILSKSALQSEKHLPINFEKLSMSPVVAFLLGLFFSFSWTPCVGPMLTSILLVAGNAATQAQGMALIGAYTLGMSLPFLIIAWLAQRLLPWIRSNAHISATIGKVSGILMMGVGIALVLNLGNIAGIETSVRETQPIESTQSSAQPQKQKAPDFALADQTGKTWKLSELKGKMVVLNFWATWCHFCTQEIPDVNEVYDHYKQNTEDVIVLAISPADSSAQTIAETLKSKGGDYPSLVDSTNEVLSAYGIQAFPMTYIIDKDGNIAQVIRGATNAAGLFSEIGKAQ